MKQDIHIIIQARMGSSRLPGKILAPFIGELSALEWIIARSNLSRFAGKTIVATTVDHKDDETMLVCQRSGCEVWRGSEQDVLGRVSDAVHAFGTRIIADVTGDNPFFDLFELDRMLEMIETEAFDYLNNHPAGLPLGTGSQVFTATAFDIVAREARDPYDREHVTPFFYHHPERFRQAQIPPLTPHAFAPHARLTLDTADDLKALQAIAQGMGFVRPEDQPTTYEILDFLQEHPHVAALNRHIVQKTFPKA